MSTINNSPFEEKHSRKFGRYLVAKQNLRAGELIFKEAPLIVYSLFSETFRSDTDFTCPSCYQIVGKRKAVHCKQCKWSFCSRVCSLDKTHRELECPVLKENEVPESPKAIHYLFLLRAIQLKENCIAKWNEILNLSSSFSQKDRDYIALLKTSSESAQHFLEKTCNIKISASLIDRLVKIMRINAFSFAEEGGNETLKKSSTALYATTCLISHSCSPNVEWGRYPGNTEERCTMALYAREDIPVGKMVSVTYTEAYNFEGTRLRRSHLLRDFSFWCECNRCSSPTELGTYLSAIKCPRCCEDGWLLPHTLMYVKDFTCQKCEFTMDIGVVSHMENTFKKKLADIARERSARNRCKRLDILILNATAKYGLHYNHYLVIDAIERWLTLLNLSVFLEPSPGNALLYQKIVQRAKQNLAVVKLFGGLDQQVTSEAIIAMATARFYFRSRDYLAISKDTLSMDDKIPIIKTIVDHFQSSISVADDRVYGPRTKAIVAIMKTRHATWHSRLSKLLSQSLKGDASK